MGLKIFAFVEALRTDAEAFSYAGKRTKGFWLAITGVALAVNVVVFNPLFVPQHHRRRRGAGVPGRRPSGRQAVPGRRKPAEHGAVRPVVVGR
jgi:hypothetical protein